MPEPAGPVSDGLDAGLHAGLHGGLQGGLDDAAIRIHACTGTSQLVEALQAELGSLIGAEHVLVYLYDDKWEELRGPVGRPEGDEVRFPSGQGIAGAAFERGETIRTPNASEDAAYDAEIDSSPEGEPGAALAMPICGPSPEGKSGERLGVRLGVIEALLPTRSGREGGFSEVHEAAALALTRHAGVALYHALGRERDREFVLDLTAALAGAVDRLRLSTVDHTWRVRGYCRRLAKAAGLDDDSRYALEAAAVLHDFGRVELEVREEPDGTLDDTAIEMLKAHVLLVEALLRNVRFPDWLAGVPDVVACHHEFIDGSGYPCGKSGEEVPRLARMLAVADGYDACLYGRRPNSRVTRSGRIIPGAQSTMPDAETEAVEYLRSGAGKLFDAELVRLFTEHRCYAIEHRRFPRIEFEAPAEVTVMAPGGGEAERFQTQALDISEGGILLRATKPLPPHTLLKLVVRLGEGPASEKLEAIARVARVLPAAAGSDSGSGGGERIGAYFLWYGSSAGEASR